MYARGLPYSRKTRDDDMRAVPVLSNHFEAIYRLFVSYNVVENGGSVLLYPARRFSWHIAFNGDLTRTMGVRRAKRSLAGAFWPLLKRRP